VHILPEGNALLIDTDLIRDAEGDDFYYERAAELLETQARNSDPILIHSDES